MPKSFGAGWYLIGNLHYIKCLYRFTDRGDILKANLKISSNDKSMFFYSCRFSVSLKLCQNQGKIVSIKSSFAIFKAFREI